MPCDKVEMPKKRALVEREGKSVFESVENKLKTYAKVNFGLVIGTAILAFIVMVSTLNSLNGLGALLVVILYTELNALRSFAFDARREYFPESNLRSLPELTEGKKIIVIGGHINWRNDLKNKYPAFQIFDGNVNTADLSSIQSADFVFLNVSNMSHAMYYKVMSILRANNIPFDYLGRAINQELCEKEMADILSKHQQREN